MPNSCRTKRSSLLMGSYLDDWLHCALQDQERHLPIAPKPLSLQFALQTHVFDSQLIFILI